MAVHEQEGNDVTFQQLLYVVEISHCGSINKASQKLYLSQSSISSAIKELEKELGIEIFQRSNHGVEFTRKGKEFLADASSLLEQMQQIESIYKKNDEESPVYFSVSTQRYPFTEDAFIRLVQASAERGRIHYSIKEAGMDMVIRDVAERQSDIGVIFLTGLTEKIIRRVLETNGLEFHEVKAIRPCVFVRRGHPLAQRESVRAADLTGYTYLNFEHDRSVAMDFSEEVQLLSLRKPQRIINVNNRATAVNVIASTDAVTTGSGLLVEGLMDDRMISIPLEGEDSIHLGWIKVKSRRLSPETLQFIELLEQSISDSIAYTDQVRKRVACTAQ